MSESPVNGERHSRVQPSNQVRIWMPLYIGDYVSDTIDLSHAEHGAYCLSMFFYWRKGESLTDGEFKNIAGKEFQRIAKFFIWCDGRWHHKRIDKELSLASIRMKVARDKSLKGVQRRRELGQLPTTG